MPLRWVDVQMEPIQTDRQKKHFLLVRINFHCHDSLDIIIPFGSNVSVLELNLYYAHATILILILKVLNAISYAKHLTFGLTLLNQYFVVSIVPFRLTEQES